MTSNLPWQFTIPDEPKELAIYRKNLVADHGKALNTTLKDLITQYLDDDASHKKYSDREASCLKAVLKDATGLDAIKFINKKFVEITTEDVEEYIEERCQVKSAAAVDFELYLLATICAKAVEKWSFYAFPNPMNGVRQPKHFIERNRQLTVDEVDLLLEAARNEDNKFYMTTLVLPVVSKLKGYERVDEALLHELNPTAKDTVKHVRQMEAFVLFLLVTGARRVETLSLRWSHVDLLASVVNFPSSKFGQARMQALGGGLVELLSQLDQTTERVFGFDEEYLGRAWRGMCRFAGFTGENELRIHDLRRGANLRLAEATRTRSDNIASLYIELCKAI